MIKTILEINGKDRTFNLPDSWLNITLKHLINLELWQGNDNDPVGLLSCFMDIDPEIIANSKKDLWDELLTILSFVYDPPKWHNLKIPKTVILDNKKIKVPRKLELERFGQKVLALQYMAEMKEDSDNIKIIPDVMAIYFQPLLDNTFSRFRLDYIKSLILGMPAIEGVPIGRFFFLKLLKSKNLGRLGLTRYQLTRTGSYITRRREVVS
jgi:hypothetical protein